jgi:MFS transporter, ACS family, glucarate transporter
MEHGEPDGPITVSDADADIDTDLDPERPSRVRYRVLAAACVLAVITYIHRVGFATASAEFKEPLGLSDTHISWLMAAFMIGYGLFEMPWGFLGDRFGVRNVLAAIVLGGSVLTAAVSLVVFLPFGLGGIVVFLIVVRFLFGAFQAGTFPAFSRMMADWMPTTERGSAQGAVWMSSRIGGALAPRIVVPLFAFLGDWRVAWALIASIGLAWCAGFWPWFRNRPEDMPQVNRGERKLIEAGRSARAVHDAGHGAVPWGRMLRSPSVWSLWLMYGFLGFSGNFYLTLLPTYLKAHRHLDSTTASWLTSLPFAFGVVGCLLGGWLSDAVIRRWGKRWGRRAVGALGLSIAGMSIAAVPWVEGVVPLAALLILTFFGNDMAMAPSWAAAADIGERYTGVLSGAMNMMGSFMAAIEALIIGRLFQADNLVAPFLILAASYALGALCWAGVDARRSLAETA